MLNEDAKANLAELLRRSLNKSRLSYRAAALRAGINTPATFTRIMKCESISDEALICLLKFFHSELNMDYNAILNFILNDKKEIGKSAKGHG